MYAEDIVDDGVDYLRCVDYYSDDEESQTQQTQYTDTEMSQNSETQMPENSEEPGTGTSSRSHVRNVMDTQVQFFF